MERIILHSDMNNFYASVECLYNPNLKGKRAAVAGDPEAQHGIVLAKNEEKIMFDTHYQYICLYSKDIQRRPQIAPKSFQTHITAHGRRCSHCR